MSEFGVRWTADPSCTYPGTGGKEKRRANSQEKKKKKKKIQSLDCGTVPRRLHIMTQLTQY